MKRTPLKRKTRLERKTRIRQVNRRRRAKLRELQYGTHAAYVRASGCVVGHTCMGECVAAHVVSRGAGGVASDLVGLCAHHHGEQHQIGIRTFERRYGIDLTAEAARLWEENGEG